MFRLSNKIVQVNFTDRTEIILSSEQKLVTYINLKGERSEYPLATALDSKNADMAKRLKYTKEILIGAGWRWLPIGAVEAANGAGIAHSPTIVDVVERGLVEGNVGAGGKWVPAATVVVAHANESSRAGNEASAT